MKTTILRKLMLIAVLLTGSYACAYNFSDGYLEYNITSESDRTVEVVGLDIYSDDYSVVIPKKLIHYNKTYTVTRIGDSAFRGCSSLISIAIPNSVTSIGEEAFRNCTGLTGVYINDLEAWCKIDFDDSVANPLYYANLYLNNEKVTNLVIPNTITEIKKYTFDSYRGLTSVTISNSVTSIGESAFRRCSSLISIAIPNSVTSIGNSAFAHCTGLTSVTIGNSVTSIGYSAFRCCNGLTSVTIPNSVTSIGESAFDDCTGLTSVTIGNSVTSIGDWAFFSCSGLTTIVVENRNTVYDSRDNCNAIIETATNTLITGCKTTIIPNSVISIRNGAFYECDDLTSVTIPNSVTSIGDWAFFSCSGLTSVTIPNSVTSIGSYAFQFCSGLTSVTIGNSVTSIGNRAFDGCSGLTDIYCMATNPPTGGSNEYPTFSDKTIQYATLYVPTGCKSAYESVDPWRNFWNIEEKEFSGVESTLADNNVNVSVENGNIVVNGATDNVNIEVYSVNGQCVYNGNATIIPVSSKGLYIVKVNNKSFKVIL